MVKSGTRRIIVDLLDLRWIQAERDYAVLHVGTERYVIRATMAAMEKSLGPEDFCRIHRSTIVNVAYVREICHTPSGSTVVMMRDGTALKSSRSYYKKLLCFLSGPGLSEQEQKRLSNAHMQPAVPNDGEFQDLDSSAV